MAYVDEYGITRGVDNSFSTLVGRLFSDTNGILLAVIPLAVLFGLFFVIKHFTKNKKIIIAYIIAAIILYTYYFMLLTSMYLWV